MVSFQSKYLDNNKKNFCHLAKFFWGAKAPPATRSLRHCSVTYNFPVTIYLSQFFLHVEYGIWCCLEYSFCQINKSQFFVATQTITKKYPFFSACLFWYVHFYENLIVLHQSDNTFLFYFDICAKLILSTIVWTMKKW